MLQLFMFLKVMQYSEMEPPISYGQNCNLYVIVIYM